MPPATSQPASPESRLFDLARTKLAVYASVGAAAFTSGLVSRVTSSHATSTNTPSLNETTQPIGEFQFSWSQVGELAIFGNESSTPKDQISHPNMGNISKTGINATIARWGKECKQYLVVGPGEESGARDHDADKKLGTLDVVRGARNSFVLRRKPGVKRCGAYGTTSGYQSPDGKLHRGKSVIVKPSRLDSKVYKDPEPKDPFSTFIVLLSSTKKG